MKLIPTQLDGVFLLEPKVFSDERGTFIKPFHKDTLEGLGLDADFKESFYSISHKNVIRGMHFQSPPHEHSKLIYVSKGKVLDVVLDIREDSPTFGQFSSAELSDKNNLMVYIRPGFAHGFLSLEDDTCVSYFHTTTHSPEHDLGVCFDSFGMDWRATDPIVSARDASFPALNEFVTPFKYTQ